MIVVQTHKVAEAVSEHIAPNIVDRLGTSHQHYYTGQILNNKQRKQTRENQSNADLLENNTPWVSYDTNGFSFCKIYINTLNDCF